MPDPAQREPIGRRALASGRVQGIGFRWSVREKARRLGLGGWVRNLHDGRVELWVEGDAATVEGFLAWLERGPPLARVDRLDVRAGPPTGERDFEVRSSAHA